MILKMHFLFEELKENVHKYSYCICDGDHFKSDLCYGSFMLCLLYLAAYWVIGYHILKKAGKDKLRLVFRKFFEHVLQQIHSGKLFDGKMFMDVAD